MSKRDIETLNKDRAQQAELRRARVQKLTAQRVPATEIASQEGVTLNQVYKDRSIARREHPEIVQKVRDEAEAAYQMLLNLVLESEEMSDGEIVTAVRGIHKDRREMYGADAPAKSIVGHINGPQLDALVLDIRAVLLDADQATKEECLKSCKEIVRRNKKPLVVDAMQLTDGGGDAYFS